LAWGQQEEEEAADKKLRRLRRLKDPVAAGALLAEMLATDPDHALDSLQREVPAARPRSTGKSCRSLAETVSYFLGLHVQPCERGRLPLPARLQGFELVESLVHLAGEVRLVAAYPLEVSLPQ
jgi:hypothetical protein